MKPTHLLPLFGTLLLPGCGPPRSSIQLVDIARDGVKSARKNAEQDLQAILELYDQQLQSLDAAFDQDIQEVSSGAVLETDDSAVQLTAAWVIRARKGYAAARMVIERQRHRRIADHLLEVKNLDAVDWALRALEDVLALRFETDRTVRSQLVDLRRKIDGQIRRKK